MNEVMMKMIMMKIVDVEKCFSIDTVTQYHWNVCHLTSNIASILCAIYSVCFDAIAFETWDRTLNGQINAWIRQRIQRTSNVLKLIRNRQIKMSYLKAHK